MLKEKIYRKIRNGNPEESEEVFNSLMETTYRGAVVAIISRNNSHSLGRHIMEK